MTYILLPVIRQRHNSIFAKNRLQNESLDLKIKIERAI